MDPIYIVLVLGVLFLFIVIILSSINRPQWLGLLVLFLLPFDNIYLVIYDLKIRPAELLGLFLLMLFIFKFLAKPRPIRLPSGFKLFIILFTVGFTIIFLKNTSTYFQTGIVLEIHFLVLFFGTCAAFWILYADINAAKLQDLILKFIGAILLFGIVQFLLYYGLHWDLSFKERYDLTGNITLAVQFTANNPESIISNAFDTPWYRPSSLFREAGYMGLAGAWLYAVSIAAFLSPGSNPGLRRKCVFYALIGLGAVTLSVARSSIFALLVCTGAAILFCEKYKHGRKARTFALCLMILPLTYFPVTDLLQKAELFKLAEGRFSSEFVSKDLRFLMYSAQWANFLNNPLLGMGPGSTEEVIRDTVPDYWEPETVPVGGYSTVFTLLNDSGAIGFFLFLTIILVIFAAVRKKSVLLKVGIKSDSVLFFNGLLSVLINSIFLPLIMGFGFFWLALALTWIFIEKDKMVLESCQSIQPSRRQLVCS